MFKVLLFSSNLAPAQGIEAILDQARAALSPDDSLSAILLSSHDHHAYDHRQALRQIRCAFPAMPVVGCSSVAEVSHLSGRVAGNAFTLLVFITDRAIRIHAGVVEDIVSPQAEANITRAFNAGSAALEGSEKVCVIFPAFAGGADPCCMTNVLTAIRQSKLNQRCKLFGGMATERWTTELPGREPPLATSFQYFNDQVLQTGMPYLMLGGRKLKFSYGYGDGVRAYTPAVPVAIENTRIVSINHREPRAFLTEHGHPLVTNDDFWIYAPLQLQHQRRTEIRDMVQEGDHFEVIGDSSFSALPVKLRLTRCTPDSIHTSSNTAIEQVSHNLAFEPAVVLGFSCITRFYLLKRQGADVTWEYHGLSSKFPAPHIPKLIFYCFGEIGPRKRNAPATFNSSSIITLALGELRESKPTSQAGDTANFQDFALLSWYTVFEALHKQGMKKCEIIALIRQDLEKRLKTVEPPSERSFR